MDTETARATLADANERMLELSVRMEELRAQQLDILRQAQALASEAGVKDAASTLGLVPRAANNRFLRLPEGATVIQALRLGKTKHVSELAFPICEAGDWAASRPATEGWLISTAPLTTVKELFNEPTRVTFLGL